MARRKDPRPDRHIEPGSRTVQVEADGDKSNADYVGLISPDDALDVGWTGAEARREPR